MKEDCWQNRGLIFLGLHLCVRVKGQSGHCAEHLRISLENEGLLAWPLGVLAAEGTQLSALLRTASEEHDRGRGPLPGQPAFSNW